MSAPHSNIAVFVPHNGCPHQCSFCNQRTITGHASQPAPGDVRTAIDTALAHPKPGAFTELAFFGGSFTAIDRSYMVSLLEAAAPYRESGQIDGIRCSTRPDCISEEILGLLKKYRVTAIELGAQSMRGEVLEANRRGHTPGDVERSSALIREYGFELGLQMMTGLYMSGEDDDIYTARKLIELRPATVRIYPTVVLRGTELERLYYEGKYDPPDAERSAGLCAKLLRMFAESGINVIRLGLHAERGIEENYVAGAYHPAMRELCESLIYLQKMRELLSGRNITAARFAVSPKELSKAIGQKRSNIHRFKADGVTVTVTSDPDIAPGDIILLPGAPHQEPMEGTN